LNLFLINKTKVKFNTKKKPYKAYDK